MDIPVLFTKVCLFSVFLLSSTVRAQSVQFKEIKVRPAAKFYDTKDSTIVFPVVVTDNPAVSRLINKEIEETVLEYDSDDKKLKTTRDKIRSWTKTGLTDMDYEVTYNKNGILSLEIEVGVTAAYPNTFQIFLNYDIRSGEPFEIGSILNDSLIKQFQAKVLLDKIDSLNLYKTELKKQFEKKEVDTAAYEWALQEVDSFCINAVDIRNFSLFETGIKIIDDCEFPHIIRWISPTYELKYTYRFLAPYLKPNIRDRLSPVVRF